MRRHPRWLLGAVPGALLAVGPAQEIEVELDGDSGAPTAILEILAEDPSAAAVARVAGAEESEAAELLDVLSDAGALLEDPPSAVAGDLIPLADALLAVLEGRLAIQERRRVIATADELLVLPGSLEPRLARRALRAFLAGIEPEGRLRAYAHVASVATPCVLGDLPAPEAVERGLAALEEEDEARVHVVTLSSGEVVSVEPGQLGRIDCAAAHRLGPVSAVILEAEAPPQDDRLRMAVARYALPNLRFPDSGKRLAGGRHPDPSTAELIARAEAAERYAGGEPSAHRLVRAGEADLDAAALDAEQLLRFNARQEREQELLTPYDPATRHLWIEGRERSGTRRYVPADAVFYPFADPWLDGRISVASSSGTAAHTDPREARTKALSELAERDAYMWTWVQRVSRELVDPASIEGRLGERLRRVASRGLDLALVNLTTDTLPVILCALHSEDRLSVGISAARDARHAIGKALDESVSFLAAAGPSAGPRPEASDVSSPEDHLRWHQDPVQIERDRFLFGSDERIALAEITCPEEPEEEILAAVGEPVTIDLTSAATWPFHVVRVVVPNSIPVSFGWDREPLGVPRLARPLRVHDGRLLGAELNLSEAGPLEPHPFA